MNREEAILLNMALKRVSDKTLVTNIIGKKKEFKNTVKKVFEIFKEIRAEVE